MWSALSSVCRSRSRVPLSAPKIRPSFFFFFLFTTFKHPKSRSAATGRPWLSLAQRVSPSVASRGTFNPPTRFCRTAGVCFPPFHFTFTSSSSSSHPSSRNWQMLPVSFFLDTLDSFCHIWSPPPPPPVWGIQTLSSGLFQLVLLESAGWQWESVAVASRMDWCNAINTLPSSCSFNSFSMKLKTKIGSSTELPGRLCKGDRWLRHLAHSLQWQQRAWKAEPGSGWFFCTHVDTTAAFLCGYYSPLDRSLFFFLPSPGTD